MAIIDLSCSDSSIGSFSHMFCVFTDSVTGSIFISLLSLLLILYVIGVGFFKLPSEFCLVLLIPLAIVSAIITAQWIALLVGLCFFFAFVIVKTWF